VLVDDRLPCLGGAGFHTQLAFCVTRRSQLWATVVEKALAKVCGGYGALCGGESGDALTLLTGWPCEIVRLGEGADLEEVWARLRSAREAGFLMTCSTMDAGAPSLLPNHVYALLDVCDLGTAEGPRARLLQIRNPNTRRRWDGAWSDHSPLWTPELRRQAASLGWRPSSFFMSLADFVEHFAHFTVCKHRGASWHQVRRRLSLPGPPASSSQGVPRSGLLLEVGSEPAEGSIGLLQPEERVRGGPMHASLGQELACIGFALLEVRAGEADALGDTAAPGAVAPAPADTGEGEAVCEDCRILDDDGEVFQSSLQAGAAVAIGGFRCGAASWAECVLAPSASYLLVPLALQAPGEDLPATAAVLTSSTVRVGRPLWLGWQAVRAAWAAYARSSDSEPEEFHGALLYMGKAEGGSLVALAENRGEGHFHVEVCVESDTLRFSRGGGLTSDWLPQGYGQILQVAQPSETSGGSAGWASSHRFLMTSSEPPGSWHCPAVESSGGAVAMVALHEPFVLAA